MYWPDGWHPLDWRIRALVRSSSRHKRPKDIDAEWVIGDLEDSEGLERLVAGADAIVHCAGAVRGAEQMDFDRINVDGTARLVQAAAKQQPTAAFFTYILSCRQGTSAVTLCGQQIQW